MFLLHNAACPDVHYHHKEAGDLIVKHKLSSLLPALFLPLAVGGLAGYFTRSAMSGYKLLKKPPFAPPGWVFPVVWTILYLLMSYASWRIWKSSSPARWEALGEYVLTLALNFLWPLIFFLGGYWLAALLVLIVLFLLVADLIRRSAAIDLKAALALVPYLLWLGVAGYLNLGIYLLNR